MKRILKKKILLLCVMVIILILTTGFSFTQDTVDKISSVSEPKLYIFIEYGEEIGKLTRSEIIEDAEVFGPDGFMILPDGTVYILDTLSNMIKHYSSAGEYLGYIELPDNIDAVDIEYAEKQIYVMGYNRDVYSYYTDKWQYIGTLPIDTTMGLYAENNTLYARDIDGNDSVIDINTINETKTKIGKEKVDNNIVINDGDEEYLIEYQTTPIGTYIIKHDESDTYIMEKEALLGESQYAEVRIGKYSNGAKIATALPIPFSENKYYQPFKKLYITDDNSVYQMVPQESGISIYQIQWTKGNATLITDEMIYNDSLLSEEKSSTKSKSYQTKAQAASRAYTTCYTGWWYDASEHRTPTTSIKAPPDQTGTTDKQIAGIPYCWGGMNGWDSGTYTGSSSAYKINFADALAAGQTAGNTNTSHSSYVSGTAGLDCNGFIAVCYKIPNKFKAKYASTYFDQLSSWDDVEEGDVANNTSHIFMIKYKYTSGGEFYMMSTYESRNNGSTYQGTKVCHRYLDDVISEGYTPREIK